jgi:hypothetical protein
LQLSFLRAGEAMAFFNKDNKFDIQLKASEIAEKSISNMLCSTKIEVKTEQHLWEKTGNIAIEYECNGKPSGISTTRADFWFHELRKEDKTYCIFCYPVEQLKQKARPYYRAGKIISGGDRNASKMVLIPIKELLQ